MESLKSRIFFGAVLCACLLLPLSNDIFISGFPAMGQTFPGANVSLVMSIFFVGLAVSQPFYGPLSDRFGRKSILLFGLWVFTIASALTMLAPTFPLLLLGRFLQALGACSASVTVLAVIRDTYEKEKLVHATSLLTALIGAGPALAPLLGSLLNTYWSWRSSFVFLFALGCFFLVLILSGFKETHKHKNMEAMDFKKMIPTYLSITRIPLFLEYCVSGAIVYAIFFSYFSLSSLFIIEQMHFDMIKYGLIVGINGIVLLSIVRLVPKLVKVMHKIKVVFIGYLFIMFGGASMWFLNSYFDINVYTFIFPMIFITLGIGLVRATTGAGAMQLSPSHTAGFASALFNGISFIFGSIVTALIPSFIFHIKDFGLLALGAGIVGCGLLIGHYRTSIVLIPNEKAKF